MSVASIVAVRGARTRPHSAVEPNTWQRPNAYSKPRGRRFSTESLKLDALLPRITNDRDSTSGRGDAASANVALASVHVAWTWTGSRGNGACYQRQGMCMVLQPRRTTNLN